MWNLVSEMLISPISNRFQERERVIQPTSFKLIGISDVK